MKRSNGMFSISRGELIKYLILIVSGIVGIGCCEIVDQVRVHLIAIWAFTAITIILSGLDLLHPYFWFPLFFSLYSTANAILYAMGLSTRISTYSSNQIVLPFIGLLVALLVIGPRKRKIEFKEDALQENKTLDVVLYIIVFVVITSSFILRSRGYSSKVVMRREGDLIYKYGVHIVRFMTIFALICSARNLSLGRKRVIVKILLSGMAALIFTLFTGERDVVFRFGYTFLLLLVAYKIVKPHHLIAIAPVGIVVMSFSVFIKYYFVRGAFRSGSGNLIYDFLTSDFSAAGGNLQKLLDQPWTKGCQGIKLLFTELFSPILIGVKTVNPTSWFSANVYSTSYSRAFTLVGTGYIIAGTIGVIIVFFIVGLIIKFFYKRANRSIYWLASYIYMSSVVIFSFRQSLQSLTDSMLKHVALGVILSIIIDKMKVKMK